MSVNRFAFLLRPGGGIEIFRSIRTLVATIVPIVIGRSINQAELGLTIGLYARLFLLADVGGLYLTRAKTLFWSIVGITSAFLVGTLVSSDFWLTILIIFCGLFIAGYLTVYGENGAAAGLVIGLFMLLSVTLPAGGIDLAIHRALISLIIGAWVIVLALLFWPFQPNQPLRQVVAKNFQSIAEYLHNLRFLSSSAEEIESASYQVREQLLKSRETLIYTKMGRWGKSDLREWLIVLIEDSDQIMTTLTTMRELINLHPLPQLTTVSILLEDAFLEVASITQDIAQLILGKTKIPDCNRLKLLIKAIEQQYDLQEQLLQTEVDNYISYTAMGQLKTWLKKLQRQLQLTIQTAQQFSNRERKGKTKAQSSSLHRSRIEGDIWEVKEESWYSPLQENFSLESPLFRHAFRLGLGSALGVLIYTLTPITNGFWIGLTLILVLKPDFSLTFQRLVYRIVGTVLGVGIVALLFAVVDNISWLEWIGIFSFALAVSLLRFHYSLAVFFFTVGVLLMPEFLNPNTMSPDAVNERVICTLIGGLLAFILSFGLGRLDEELRFLSSVVTAIEKVNLYFRSVMAVYLGETSYSTNIFAKNRNTGRVANATMQIALQRLINDPSTPFETIEPAISIVNHIPRISRGVTVLLTQLEQFTGSKPHPKVALFTQQVTEGLTQLAQSLQDNELPKPLPPVDKTIEEILSDIEQLREKRLTEIAKHQDGTSTEEYLRDYNIVSTDLEEIVRRLEDLNGAIIRFKKASLTIE